MPLTLNTHQASLFNAKAVPCEIWDAQVGVLFYHCRVLSLDYMFILTLSTLGVEGILAS